MAAAPRVNPEDFFSPEEWAHLSHRSSWRGLACVAHCWAVIGACMALVAWSPWFLPLAILWVGNRQLGLFILMHDAAHAVLHPSRRINDAVGFWFCGTEMTAYRAYHLQHHRYVQQTEDPDLVLSAPFPINRASLRRKMWRDISGQTFYKQRMAPGVMAWRSPPPGLNRWSSLGQWMHQECWFLGGNAVFALAFAAVGCLWLWLVLWLFGWMQLFCRLVKLIPSVQTYHPSLLSVQAGVEPALHAAVHKALAQLFHVWATQAVVCQVCCNVAKLGFRLACCANSKQTLFHACLGSIVAPSAHTTALGDTT
jgi:fatty acid desaturase